MTVQSAAFAIAYGLWARNKRGYLLCGAGMLVLALLYPLLFAYTRAAAAVLASAIPLLGIFGFVLNSAIFAQEPGNLSSSYPRHMLVLPVRSGSLVFWPMLYGAIVAIFLWVFTATAIYGSSGLAIPVVMPALALVVVTCWFQALAWIPLAVRWLRDLIGITSTILLGAVPIGIMRRDPDAIALVAALLLVYLVATCALATAAVKAERRGDTWTLWFKMPEGRIAASSVAPRRSARAFKTQAMAQFWYEWRCHGLYVVGFLGCLSMVMWGCLLLGGKPILTPLFPLVVGLLLFAPIGAAGSMGPALARLRPFWVEHRPSMTFLAVRPMQSGGFVAAKMRMSLVTVLLSWVFTLGGTALCIWLSRSMPAAIFNWRRFETLYPGGRAPLICVLVCILMPVVTWRLLTDGFPFVLTGRKWVADGAVWLYLAAVTSLVSGGLWLGNHQDQLPRVLAIAPWLVGAGAALKVSIGATAFRLAIRRGLIGWPAFRRIFGCWVAFTGLAVSLVILVNPPAALVSKPAMFLGLATAVPLVRFPLAALAFDWNRHR